MEFVHKCPPRRHARLLSHRIALPMLALFSASAPPAPDSNTHGRYNLISRCLDIVKAELARAAVVCSSQVTPPRLALSNRAQLNRAKGAAAEQHAEDGHEHVRRGPAGATARTARIRRRRCCIRTGVQCRLLPLLSSARVFDCMLLMFGGRSWLRRLRLRLPASARRLRRFVCGPRVTCNCAADTKKLRVR
jgi:hypothetical protein